MKILILFLMLSILFVGCSNQQKSQAKMKISLGNLLNMPTGVGDGGAILYGQSSNGEIIGKAITGSELNLTLNNGQWKFWALFWDNSSTPLNGKVLCGKTSANLNGTDASLAISVTNANCSDSEFTSMPTYLQSVNNHFADFFMEDCDNVAESNGRSCGFVNRGSALSYRLIFNEFNAGPGAGLNFSGATIASACISNAPATGFFDQPMPVNFPAGNGTTPFIIKAQLFLGSTTCDTTDPKGFHEIVFGQGIAGPIPGGDKVITSTQTCTAPTTTLYSIPAVPKDIRQIACKSDFGSWMGSGNGTCTIQSITPANQLRFFDSTNCSTFTSNGVNPAIKHLVQIPTAAICNRYLGSSSQIGFNHPFAAGDGSTNRPFKICTEWQLNQIGEWNSPGYQSQNFKLLSDLDMNKTDLGTYYASPNCKGIKSANFNFSNHNNFNPLDKAVTDATCNVASTTPFNGTFLGGNHTIYNLRNNIDGMSYNGFIRNQGMGSLIMGLNFVNSEVSGLSNVGVVAGYSNGPHQAISNINIENANVQANSNSNSNSNANTAGTNVSGGSFVGAISGYAGTPDTIRNVHVVKTFVGGSDSIGGITGYLSGGPLENSSFQGTINADNGSSGSFAGGLVGNASSTSLISNSFSEGTLVSQTLNTGGIAGSFTGTSITDVYSTMAILARNNFYGTTAPVTNIGGLVGVQTTGSIIDAVYDGIIINLGSASSIILNDVATMSGSTCTNVAASGNVNANCAASPTAYTNLRSGSVPFANAAKWIQVAGSIPRLASETRECITDPTAQDPVATQATNGRGSVTNPILICNSTQFTSLDSRALGENYRLVDPLNLSSVGTTTIGLFNGNFFGGDQMIYGYNPGTMDFNTNYYGIFQTNNGLITNTNFIGNNFVVAVAAPGIGVVVGDNNGTISNVHSIGNIISGVVTIGSIAGINESTGVINQTYVNYSKISNYGTNLNTIGGISGVNYGHISQVSTDIAINSNASFSGIIGGISGANMGTIDQSKFKGRITISNLTANPTLDLGGIVGMNNGTISNSLTENQSEIDVADHTNIGGLIGHAYNTSILKNSFALGKVLYNNAGAIQAPASNFNSLIGLDDSSTVTDTYYLINNIGSITNTTNYSVTSCGGTSPNYIVNYATLPTPVQANSDAIYFNNGGGNQLSNLFSTSIGLNYTAANIPSCNIGNNLNFAKLYTMNANYVGLTSSDFGNIAKYSNYDISYEDPINPANNIAYQRMIDYYVAIMDGLPAPVNSPIWAMQAGDPYPNLMQLNDR